MKQLNYLEPMSTQTLREGIVELRAAEGADGDAAENVAPDLLRDIDVHDAIHVVFACPTNLAGEIVAHVWTAFGTTTSIHDMHRVSRHRDHRTVLAEIGHRRLLGTWLKSLPLIAKTVFRARRMRRRWPAEEFAAYLHKPLAELRAEFGIEISPVPRRGRRAGGAALRSIRRRQSLA